MSNFRRWQLDANSPLALQLASDIRLNPAEDHNDQVWELLLGIGNSPALALQTRYGGHVGLASLVPMWLHGDRVVYEAQAYAKPPYVTAFAPGYLRVQATLSSQLSLQAEYWAMESHATGGQFTISNARTSPQEVRLDLVAFVASGGKEQPPNILTMQGERQALHMGKIGNLNPVVVLEGGSGDSTSPKLGKTWTIAGRKKVVVRWVHAGLTNVRDSLALAERWLKQNWSKHFKQIAQAAQNIPLIETGDEEQDATIAFAYQQLVHSFLNSPPMPNATSVAVRQPARGEYYRESSGQPSTLAYLSALAMAPIDAERAQGIVRNTLSNQQNDGWISLRLDGQRQPIMSMPILARLTWGLFQYTEDHRFLVETFPKLLKFFERWFAPDLDEDQDGLPEWLDESQTGYVYTPTFAAAQPWGQGADISLVETPDLAAYLLSEAVSLREMAYYLRDTDNEHRLGARIEALTTTLGSLWNSESSRYVYRDRDVHLTTGSVTMLENGRGDEEHLPGLNLTQPNRVIVQVSGGFEHVPNMTLHLTGLDQHGSEINETAKGNDFVWHLGRGVYTSRNLYAQVGRIWCDGLSRVYRIDARTVDTTRLDINALLPLWSPGISEERATALVRLITDKSHFWRANGVSMNSAQDSRFDPANVQGSGAVWPFWLTLLGEGLIEHGYVEEATEMIKRLLTAQVSVLKQEKAFFEFYHSDQPRGLGDRGHVGGIVPLHLLLRVLGVRIVSTGKVWAGGAFAWDKPVTVTQHGVMVHRSRAGTQVRFPSGHEVALTNDSFREVIDPHPTAPTRIVPIEIEPLVSSRPVSIEVQRDTDD